MKKLEFFETVGYTGGMQFYLKSCGAFFNEEDAKRAREENKGNLYNCSIITIIKGVFEDLSEVGSDINIKKAETIKDHNTVLHIVSEYMMNDRCSGAHWAFVNPKDAQVFVKQKNKNNMDRRIKEYKLKDYKIKNIIFESYNDYTKSLEKQEKQKITSKKSLQKTNKKIEDLEK